LASVLGHFLVVFKFFNLCSLCVNLFGRMYNIKDESNLLSHKLQLSIQWYLKSHDSVSMRNSPVCSSLSPKLQEPLSLNFIVSHMWAKYRRLNSAWVISYTSDCQPTKIPVNRGLLNRPSPRVSGYQRLVPTSLFSDHVLHYSYKGFQNSNTLITVSVGYVTVETGCTPIQFIQLSQCKYTCFP